MVHRIVPGKEREPEKRKHEKTGEDQERDRSIFFRGKMHENGGDQSSLKHGDEHRHGDVRFARPEIDIGQCDGNAGEDEQGRAHHHVFFYMMRDLVSVMLVLSRHLAQRSGGLFIAKR